MQKITQFVAHLSEGDAISRQVLILDEIFKNHNLKSKIVAQFIDKKNLPGIALQFKDNLKIEPDEIIVFHLSDYTEISKFVKNLANKKILIYHNITPSYFFRKMAKSAQANSALGRFWLKKLAPYFDLALGVSEFNKKELEETGYQKTGVFPLIFEQKFYQKKKEFFPKPKGSIQFLTVGRIAPNKKIEDVINIFYFFHKYLNHNSRLLVVGKFFKEFVNYENYLKEQVKKLDLCENVIFTGPVSQPELNFLYSESDLYLTMSLHEGFCLPVLEAFYFGLPVIAFKTGGIAETMGGAGLLVENNNPALISELIHNVLNSKEFLKNLVTAQQKSLERFSKEKIEPLIFKYLEQLND